MQADYALRALFTLASHVGKKPITINELAVRNDMPKKFLEHIMLDLKGRGWVRSVTGKYGGYLLAMNPEIISMGEVLRYFDGPLAPIPCVSVTKYRCCSQEATCRFRRVMLEARNLVAKLMDDTTLADLMRKPPVTSIEIHGIDGEGI